MAAVGVVGEGPRQVDLQSGGGVHALGRGAEVVVEGAACLPSTVPRHVHRLGRGTWAVTSVAASDFTTRRLHETIGPTAGGRLDVARLGGTTDFAVDTSCGSSVRRDVSLGHAGPEEDW